jgi:ectoine hydroxylase-related dioxygenase (phytanoyl-CoA dioxygenase family)
VLHVDSSVPDPLPPWKIRLNINLLLDPFTETNGATLVYPGSHKFLRKPTSGDDVSLQMRKVIAPAGSLVLWTGHLWHQSGSNHDTRPRAALLACFAASYLREVAVEENYLEVMDRDRVESLPFEVKTILGYYHGRKV